MKTYLVGGAVRDQLMGKDVSDLDWVVVGATHDEMIVSGYERVGADFPVYLHPETKDEYALARTERKSGKGYLGFEVKFGTDVTIEQDLERRDLTINSIAMERGSEGWYFTDPFNGRADIQNKVLRHTSPAFSEDPLRVIRLARFYARFEDFTIAPETVELASKLVDSGELEHLSRERFWAEMEKTLDQTARLDRFFSALDIFGVMDKVSFFKDVFGTPWCQRQTFLIPAIAANLDNFYIPLTLQLDAFVALIASDNAEQKSQVIPLKAKKLTSAIRAIRSGVAGRSLAENILGFLKSQRAFTAGSGMDDIINTMRLGEHVGIDFPISSLQLSRAFHYASAITGVNYQHLSGPAVGRAIDADRLEAIDVSLRDQS